MEGVSPDIRDRLPRTVAIALNEQRRTWDRLFPAEQRLYSAQIGWLEALPPKDLQALFAPVQELESRMEVSRLDPGQARLTIADTGVLARSPLYPKWRSEVEKAFAAVEKGVENDERLKPAPRLVVCLLPAGLPLDGQELWGRVSAQGRWATLSQRPGTALPAFVDALAARKTEPRFEPVETTWLVEADARFVKRASSGLTVLSFAELAAVRRAFLDRLNNIPKDLSGADRAHDDLRDMNLAKLMPGRLLSAVSVREFTRTLLMSGNGALVFGNSFVQWGSSEAFRRAQPQALVACFGIRNRPKPFSSIVMFEDQNRANPAPDVPDPAGSLADAELLSEYVVRSAQRLSPYSGHTVHILAVEDAQRVLLLEPRPVLPAGKAIEWQVLERAALGWLEGGVS